ncbi:hypothetical protein LTR95_008172 [Oleoguttula sp. CCFEE 5521]
MRFYLLSLILALFGVLSFSATTPQRPIVVSYPAGTPDYVIQEAIDAIKNAGGLITHEYKLIKGFAAKVSKEAVAAVQSLKNGAIIEEDQEMSITGS